MPRTWTSSERTGMDDVGCSHRIRGAWCDSICEAPIKEVRNDGPRTTRICVRGHGVVSVKCECGREVECDAFTNTCQCGADYGHSGYRLAPRSQWGEETGESASDILNCENYRDPEEVDPAASSYLDPEREK